MVILLYQELVLNSYLCKYLLYYISLIYETLLSIPLAKFVFALLATNISPVSKDFQEILIHHLKSANFSKNLRIRNTFDAKKRL